jgi:hypothetical protein
MKVSAQSHKPTHVYLWDYSERRRMPTDGKWEKDADKMGLPGRWRTAANGWVAEGVSAKPVVTDVRRDSLTF